MVTRPSSPISIQDLLDKLSRVPLEHRGRFVFFDPSPNDFGYECVSTVHVDKVGDVILNAHFIKDDEEVGRKL